ncbi:MAG TPA: hypothetical protein PKA31_01380 [Candidatus Moranbacteria bacterium]|nr:hypothetical protein [Candidatus Moranbacteria bacterium]
MKNLRLLPVLLGVLGVAVLGASKAEAASSWKDYFTRDEAKVIKKTAEKYIREQIEQNSKEWKGIISSKMIDDEAINAKKVDGTIAKKKVVTVKIDSVDEADKMVGLGGMSFTDSAYYKKISIPEIKTSDSPNVVIYKKESFESLQEPLGENHWSEFSGYSFTDGEIWIKFYDTDEDNPFSPREYKISVNY